MTENANKPDLNTISKYNEEQLYAYFISEVVSEGQIWILVDEYGSVMLNTEDEDCVPVWPSLEMAQAWATAEWGNCKAEAISLDKWHKRWTGGLEEDGFAVVICPLEDREGLVIYPEDLEKALQKRQRKVADK